MVHNTRMLEPKRYDWRVSYNMREDDLSMMTKLEVYISPGPRVVCQHRRSGILG